MRLISLNTWGSRLHKPITEFIRAQKGATDIFCFQEVFHSDRAEVAPDGGSRLDGYNEIVGLLGDNFVGFFAPISTGRHGGGLVDYELGFGNATFVRRPLAIESHDVIFVYGEEAAHQPEDLSNLPRHVIISKITAGDTKLTVMNFHGTWIPGTEKQDNPRRIDQSNRLREIIDSCATPVILAGDFNLVPDGQSLAILEKGMRNLVKEFGVTSTRSSVYKKPMKFADYILVTPEIQVNDFKVLPDEVSDHLPLMLDFS